MRELSLFEVGTRESRGVGDNLINYLQILT